MLKILIDNPLILLFLVAAIGYPLGQIKVRGSSLGVAAVLFVGLAFGSIDPNLKLPEVIYVLGLILFVYTIGLSSGPAFVASLRREGLRNNLLIVSVILISTGIALLAYKFLRVPPAMTAGMLAGSLTNTPALAAALETLKQMRTGGELEILLAEPVVGYSITYPMGVIGMVLAISVMQRVWKIDYAAEARTLRAFGMSSEPLENCTIKVTNPAAAGSSIHEVVRKFKWEVIFGRIKHAGGFRLATADAKLALGDLVTAVGTADELNRVTAELGELSPEEISLERSEFDYRRIFVSNPQIVGKRLQDLNLQEGFGAVITRVRRGDHDLLPHDQMVLELGDRVRVITSRERMGEVTSFFGDSYRGVSEIDILTFSLGLVLGLLLGIVPFPLPGGMTLKLGFAGGPLVVALILSTLGRTGTLIWSLPYSVNMTLRQIGLVLFLAGIGTRAGYSFLTTFTNAGGIYIFAAGIVITCTAAFLTLWIGYRLLKIPMNFLVGILAGLQTQPAVLGYALDQSGSDLPNVGYTSVYPVATITKILIVQLIVALLL